MSRRKGNKTEREAVQLYEQAGFDLVDRVGSTGGGRRMTDAFGHVDIIAIAEGRRTRFVQAKTNGGGGVRAFVEWAAEKLPEHIVADFIIRYDGSAAKPPTWALRRVDAKPGGVTYQTVVDERKDGVPAGGAGIVEYLEGDDGR